MSGICGIVNFDGAPVDPAIIEKMTAAAAYRGPDGIACWRQGHVALAHLALHSTPESLRERQPLLSPDGAVCLAADARLDNREDLILTLTARGHLQDPDPTDADLILAAYRGWGEDCPKRLIGAFAFALWDESRQQLFCARDVFGLKPLHYARVGQMFCFASEAQQVIQHPAVPRRLDETAVADFLSGYFDDTQTTIFLDLRRQPAANILVARRSGDRLWRYWDIEPRTRIHYSREEEYAERFLELFTRAVAAQLRTQASTVGILMSGGIDSCSVAAVAQRLLAGGPTRLAACSMVFDRLPNCDERRYSQLMIDELGVDVEYIPADQNHCFTAPFTVPPAIEDAFLIGINSANIADLLTRFRPRDACVVLTGQGGDNGARGTNRVILERLLRNPFRVLSELAQYAREQGIPYYRVLDFYLIRWLLPEPAYLGLRRLIGRPLPVSPPISPPPWLNPEFATRTGIAARLRRPPAPRRFLSPARQTVYTIATRSGLIDRWCCWFEYAGAHCGLEGRHPFLDRRLVEFLVAIPPEQLLQSAYTKLLVRRAMEGILPEAIRQRLGKTDLMDYSHLMLREFAVAPVEDLLSSPWLAKMEYVDGPALRQAYQRYRAGDHAFPMMLFWYFLSLELWLKHYHHLLN